MATGKTVESASPDNTENKTDTKALTPRNTPVQARSRKRAQHIIDVTGELLERVGFDDLTTILIAKEVGISVGTLYHYFPNKQAILFAMGSQWLEQMKRQLDEIDRSPLEEMSLEEAVELLITQTFKAYRKQKALLILVQAMFTVPDLHELEQQHDELVISRMAEVFKRMGVRKHVNERTRIARLYLEMIHSLFLMAINQKPEPAKRTLSDIKALCLCLLARHQQE